MMRLAGSLLLAIATLACTTSAPAQDDSLLAPKLIPLSPPPSDVRGQLIYLDVAEVKSFDLASAATRELFAFPEGTYPGGLSASSDSAQLSFSLYQPGESLQTPGGTSIFLMNPDGTDRRKVLSYAVPGEALLHPAWTGDSQYLFYSRWSPMGERRIERADVNGSDQQTVIENAHSPTVSLTGKLAYLAPDPVTLRESIWVASADGSDKQRLFDESLFETIAAPRFSPDGSLIAFVAVGGPGTEPPPAASSTQGFPLTWPEPALAEAHGIPWDLWIITPDGGVLRRLTDLSEDSPIPAWSPDGKWIAFGAELGLYLAHSQTGEVRRILDGPALGGIAWVR